MADSVVSLVTPLILTYNEEPNIKRTLESLLWAERVVVLDSGSTDGTKSIARLFPNVSWYVRPFDYHCAQRKHGIHYTDIATDFVLALDADLSAKATFAEETGKYFTYG